MGSVEDEILALSLAKFGWKTSGQIDRVEDLFADDLHFVHITGHVSSKAEWIGELRSGRFVYNRIEPRGAAVALEEGRAVLKGKAVFTVTMGGHRGQYRLAFTETYVRRADRWKLVELLTSTYRRDEGNPMTKILILGANGQLARNTTKAFLGTTDAELTLYLRRSSRLANPDPGRVRIVDGDVNDSATLRAAMTGQDVVYANLAGDMERQATSIVEAMRATGLKRLIFISSMGIYGEVPGEKYRSVLDPYRDSAAVIEKSELDYTVLRPGWFTRQPLGPYRITPKGEPFHGHDISLDSLSALIVKLATTPNLHVRSSIGVSDA